jgi:glutamate synthase (NADPH/NADH) small chain
MDSEKLMKLEALCIAEHSPACVAECPFHLDVKAFLGEIQKGDFERAYKLLDKKIPMTGILCRICDAPCENRCIRKGFGGAINISMLERTVANLDSAKRKDDSYKKSEGKVAVIGAGISGLNAVLELLKRGFDVHLFEKEERIGGRLLKIDSKILPEEVLNNELDYIEKSVTEASKGVFVDHAMLDELKKSCKAVFVAHGQNFIAAGENVFHKGNTAYQNNNSIIQSAASGRSGGITIERYLKGISLTAVRETEGSYETKLIVNTEKVVPEKIISNDTDEYRYSNEEAAKEAERCINCECNECARVCVHLRRYKMNIKKYIRQINHNERLVLGNHTANIMINSCSMCGLCTEFCPVGLNLKQMVKESRESMVSRGKMPPSAHDFALKDMEYNNSEEFKMVKNQPGFEKSSFVFFPGCQMAASEPEYVIDAYKYLTQNLKGGVGLIFGCCGAPANWAGRQELFNVNIENLRKSLEVMGNPKIILGCSTCYDLFKNNLCQFETKSIWEIYEKYGLPEGTEKFSGKKIAVQDACTSRHHPVLQESAREVIRKLGLEMEELEFSKQRTKCCGYGGLVLYADKSMAKDMIKERISESELDYAAYCFMCRDLFKSEGKRIFHIFDFIYGKDLDKIALKKAPTISERQQNRKLLKNRMLNIFWGENMKVEEDDFNFKLELSDEVVNKLEDRLILLKDIKTVLKHAEETGRKFVNPENGHFLSSKNSQHVTYWVEYARTEEGYAIFNAYSHRMEIVEG